MRILIIEDDRELSNVMKSIFSKEMILADQCFSGEEAFSYLAWTKYDALLVDIVLPGISGLEVVRKLRKEKNGIPIIIISAKDTVKDRVEGLNIGADDYLIKPFEIEELLARIKANVRREYGGTSNNIQAGDLCLDIDTYSCWVNQKRIDLTRKEFLLLEYLMKNRHIVVSRDKILNNVWGFDYEGNPKIIDVYIRSIRKKIGHGRNNSYIKAIRGVGYIFSD